LTLYSEFAMVGAGCDLRAVLEGLWGTMGLQSRSRKYVLALGFSSIGISFACQVQ